MASRPFSRACTGVLILALASSISCSKNSNTTAPPVDSTSPLSGNWIGVLSGPAETQESGWFDTSRDSIWLVFDGTEMEYHMARSVGSAHSLSPPADSCFDRYPVALNALSDLGVSFRLNLSQTLPFATSVPFQATRSGNTLAGTAMIPGDTLAGQWTATFCATCSDASVITSINPSTRSVGGSGFTLAVNGSNYTRCSVVRVNGEDRKTTFVSASQLTIPIDAADQAVEGMLSITVFTPSAAGGVSNELILTVQ